MATLTNKQIMMIMHMIKNKDPAADFTESNARRRQRRFCVVCRVNDRKYFLAHWNQDRDGVSEMVWTRNTAMMVMNAGGGGKILFDEIRDRRPHAELYLMDADDIMEAYPPREPK